MYFAFFSRFSFRLTHFTFYCISNAFFFSLSLFISISASGPPHRQLWFFFLMLFTFISAFLAFPFSFISKWKKNKNWPWNNIFISFHFYAVSFPTAATVAHISFSLLSDLECLFFHSRYVYQLLGLPFSVLRQPKTFCFDFHLLCLLCTLVSALSPPSLPPLTLYTPDRIASRSFHVLCSAKRLEYWISLCI